MSSTVQSSKLHGRSEPSADPINSSINGSEAAHRSASNPSDPEVVAVKRRRLISQSDKRRIVREYDRCKKPGERGTLLRKERVYSSMLTGWRKQLARADQASLGAIRRGPKVNPATAQKRRDEQLNREIARLTRQLGRATAIIEDFGRDSHYCAPPEQNRAGPI
jgi:transposase-like protein